MKSSLSPFISEHGKILTYNYVVDRSRDRIIAALGLDLVDNDTPENCVNVGSDLGAHTIAVFRNQDTLTPAPLQTIGIHVMRSTNEGLDLRVDINSKMVKNPESMERVMQALDFKQDSGT